MNKASSAFALCFLLQFCVEVFALDQQHKISLTEAEKNWLKEHPVIPFAPDPFFPPIEFIEKDGKLVGISVDYLNLIGSKLGVKFKPIRAGSWSEAVDSVISGRAYMLSAQVQTEGNEQDFYFSSTYLKFPAIILARDKVVQKVQLDDLSGKRLALIKDYPDFFIRANYPEIEIVEVNDAIEGLRMVAFGQVYAMPMLQPVASYYLAQEGIPSLRVIGVIDTWKDTSFAVNRGHPILVSILNKAIAATSQKEMEQIQSQWFSLRSSLTFDYGPLIKLSLGAGAVILLLVILIAKTSLQKRQLTKEITIKEQKDRELKQIMEELQEANRQLEISVITDPLTGAINRRGFYELMATEHSRVIRYGGKFALLMLDVDHFKKVNDTHGHSAGDKTLRKLTEVCATVVRTVDIVSRIGGEEFAVLLPNTSLDSAVLLAERIRNTVDNVSIEIEHGVMLKISVSIGVAAYERGDTPDTILKKADQALYTAKNNGRNQIICYQAESVGAIGPADR